MGEDEEDREEGAEVTEDWREVEDDQVAEAEDILEGSS